MDDGYDDFDDDDFYDEDYGEITEVIMLRINEDGTGEIVDTSEEVSVTFNIEELRELIVKLEEKDEEALQGLIGGFKQLIKE